MPTPIQGVSFPTIKAPLRVLASNPRYFTDGSGRAILLTGSHTWSNFQDNGAGYPPPVFDYSAYLDFLVKNNHNFFRLWTWEQTRWTSETTDNNYWFYPSPPYQRTGPGTALDGKPKIDLSKWDQAYFDRLRQRVIDAGNRGIYVSVMLFNGWSATQGDPQYGAGKNNPWKGHPFNKNNNINGINGDTNGDNQGFESYNLSIPAVTAIQDAYVKKTIDTVNDLDNVLYEICNECTGTKDWQYHMVNLIHNYEKGKPKQHPVGMTHIGDDTVLRASPADWISITNAGSLIPPVADGGKVSILDTDHICGVCGDRTWVWEAFTRGHNPIFMDAYDGAAYGTGGAGFTFNDPRWVSLRANMGYARTYANRMNLAAMTPQPSRCSTGYCLVSSSEFLAYLPSGGSITLNLSATSGNLNVEWFNPQNGTTTTGPMVSGGSSKTFVSPFSNDTVLYLYNPSAPYDDNNINWSYTGKWQTYVGSGPYNNTLHYTGTIGDTASFSFSGAQFIFSYTQYSNRGSFEVYIDGSKVATINANGTTQWQKKYVSPAYSSGTHVALFKNIGGSGNVMDVDAIQILNTPIVGTGKYDDTSASWSYAGTWLSYSGNGPYNSTLHYTSTIGNIVSFPFNGNQFILSYTQNTNRGSFEVYVDGSKITTINANGALQWQKTYTSPIFSTGAHVAQFRNIGGSGSVMDVDAIQILTTSAPGAGKYDDSNVSWSYAGTWQPYSGTGPYNSTLHYTTTVGNTASFQFNGTQFIFSYTQYPNRGSFEVYVDGSKITTINANGTVQWQKTYTSPTFAAGTHTVQFKNIGGSGTVIDVDAIQIN